MAKNPAAVALGKKGGEARAKKLTKEERSESARKAAKARWRGTMKLLDASTGLMECTECGSRHYALLQSGGRYKRGSRRCQHGCKKSK